VAATTPPPNERINWCIAEVRLVRERVHQLGIKAKGPHCELAVELLDMVVLQLAQARRRLEGEL
jgi:hypothetical protein